MLALLRCFRGWIRFPGESAFAKGNCESQFVMQIYTSFFVPALLMPFRYRTIMAAPSSSRPRSINRPLILVFEFDDSPSLTSIKQLSISFYLPHFLSKSHLLSSLLPKITCPISQFPFFSVAYLLILYIQSVLSPQSSSPVPLPSSPKCLQRIRFDKLGFFL